MTPIVSCTQDTGPQQAGDAGLSWARAQRPPVLAAAKSTDASCSGRCRNTRRCMGGSYSQSPTMQSNVALCVYHSCMEIDGNPKP